jgi:TonB-dependent SusC/RagA subfamily outer membrane receptor
MKTILVYGLQMIIASGILYGYYHFFLRNKNFHRYNRYYLLMAVVISIGIPFLNIPVYFTNENTDNSFVMQTLSVIASPAEEETTVSVIAHPTQTGYTWFTWQNIFYALYFLIAIVFVTRILLSVRKIRIISRNYPSEKIGDINFVNTTEPGTPFSFFKWLFWNKEIELQSEKGEQIFRHELFHIQQQHSADIVFIETITAIGWFNPFFHLIKKELKAIHEFLADEYAMQKTESWKYAELLLMQALNTKQNLVNPFFHTQIKRRIAMITTSQKPGHQYLRKLLVLPFAAIIVALFAFSYKKMKAENDSALKSGEPITIVVDAGHGGTDKGARSVDKKYNEADLTLEISKMIMSLAPEYNINVVMTREDENFPDGATNIKEGLKKRVEISNSVNAAAFLSVHVNAAGMPKKATTRSGFELYISKRKEVENDKRLATGILDEVSRIYKTDKLIKQREQPGIFVLDNTATAAINLECGYITNPKDLAFITDKSNQEKIARAILNGVKRFATNKSETISVIDKGKQIVDTPKFSPPKLKDTVPPLLVINGKVSGRMQTTEIDKKLSPNDIESITVLKGPSAITKYGEQGRNGVIEIITKKPNDSVTKPADSKPTLGEVVVTTTDKLSNNDPIFSKVETPPAFPGGLQAWRKFLEKNLDATIPVRDSAQAGTYTILVQFIVDKSGEIRSLKALTKHGHGMEEEVVRAIGKGPKWEPAKQNGHIVNAFHTQPVTFVITEEVKPDITITKSQNDYTNPSNWDYNDPDFLAWRQNAITEIIQIARKEGRAAYTYKGRTYIFAKITDPNPRINTYTELDGLNHQFILNGSLINSLEEINKRYKREDIKKLYFSKRSEIKEKYEIDISQDVITEIETYQ